MEFTVDLSNELAKRFTELYKKELRYVCMSGYAKINGITTEIVLNINVVKSIVTIVYLTKNIKREFEGEYMLYTVSGVGYKDKNNVVRKYSNMCIDFPKELLQETFLFSIDKIKSKL